MPTALQFAGGAHEPKTPTVIELQEAVLATLGSATERIADAASLTDCGNFAEANKQLGRLKIEIARAEMTLTEVIVLSNLAVATADRETLDQLIAAQAADQ